MPLFGEARGRLHLGSRDPTADLGAEATLDAFPQPREQRRIPAPAGPLVREEGTRPFRIELDRDPVEGPGVELPAEGLRKIDDVRRPEQQDRALGRRAVHVAPYLVGPYLPSPQGPNREAKSADEMAWTLFTVPTTKRPELDAALHDDVLSRQSQKLRDAATLGGPVGTLYVLLEGSAEAMARADSLLSPIGTKVPIGDAEGLYRHFKDEDDAASAGMGLFFTEG